MNFQQYLGNEKLFITTLDTRIARIYPISVWEQNEKLLFDQTDDTDAAEDLAFVANHFGADGDIDSQGRILLPTELRRTLNLENQPVRLDYFQGAINVVSEPVYEERQKRAMADLGEKLKAMKKKGLK